MPSRRGIVYLFLAGLMVFGTLPPPPAFAALIPPAFLNYVVALGNTVNGQWKTEGTGFLYGDLISHDNATNISDYDVYLVTAGHVVRPHIGPQASDLTVRVNPKNPGDAGGNFVVPTNPGPGTDRWFFHPNPQIDIAAVRINAAMLRDRGFEYNFFRSDQESADIEEMKDIGVSEGDGVFVLGFPINLAGSQRNYTIVRSGGIARLSEMMARASTTFMIDSLVFPGNSGSPVVLKPDVEAIQGTKNNNAAKLIGMVLSYVPYDDVAVSEQTQRPRVVFEENSGLTDVLPVDYINEAIQAWKASTAQPATPPAAVPATPAPTNPAPVNPAPASPH